MTCIVGIDPGPTETAWCRLDDGRPTAWAKEPTEKVLASDWGPDAELVIEMIASYGMAVGREVFETCVWIGRLEQMAEVRGRLHRRLFRIEIKTHLCHAPNAKDANVRAALIDRYGPGKDLAIGRKAAPGPLYGMAGDCWAALAVACTAYDRRPRYE